MFLTLRVIPDPKIFHGPWGGLVKADDRFAPVILAERHVLQSMRIKHGPKAAEFHASLVVERIAQDTIATAIVPDEFLVLSCEAGALDAEAVTWAVD